MPLHKENQAISGRWGSPAGYETIVPNPKLKLLDQIREDMRLKHYSIRNRTLLLRLVAAVGPISSYAGPGGDVPRGAEMEAFLSHPAVKGNVAVSTGS